jgi:restriction system protein
VLSQFEEFQEFRGRTPRTTHPDEGEFEVSAPEQTREEQIDSAYRLPRTALAAELLDRVKEQSPAFFEQLVLDVLRAMGLRGHPRGCDRAARPERRRRCGRHDP